MAKSIVILGCEAAGLETALRIKKKAKEEAEITVISKDKFYTHKPFLKKFFRKDRGKEVTINLDFLLSEKGITFINEDFKSVDYEDKTVNTSKSEVKFDFLIAALPMESDDGGAGGVEKHALPYQDEDDAHKITEHLRKKLASAKSDEDKTIVVCGGGPAGVELAAELNEFLDEICDDINVRRIDVKLVLLEKSSSLLPGFPKKAKTYVHHYLSRHGVDVRVNSEVKSVSDGKVSLKNGKQVSAGTIIWCSGVKPDSSLRNSEIRTNDEGAVLINPYMQSVNEATIYALGEGAIFREANYSGPEKSSLSNINRECKVVSNNIVTNLKEGDKKIFEFKKTPIWISLGEKNCVLSWGKFILSGSLINIVNNIRESLILKKWK